MSILYYPNIPSIIILTLTLIIAYLISKHIHHIYIFSRFKEIIFFFLIAFALKLIIHLRLEVTFFNIKNMAAGMLLFALTTGMVKAAIILLIGAIFPKSKLQAALIFEKVLYFLYFVISVALLLGYVFDVRVGALLTTSAIVTGLVGLAAKDVLIALAKSIFVSFESTLNLGDWIQIGDHIGKVIEISIYHLKLLGIKEEVIIYPIKEVLDGRIINYSSNMTHIRCALEIGVSYNNSPQKVKATLKGILSDFPDVLQEPAPKIRLRAYGDFSINYLIIFAISDFGKKWEIEDMINTAIWERFKQEGIVIPFPIMDVTIHQPENSKNSKKESEFKDMKL